MLTRDYDQAIVALKQSAGRNPNHPYVHLNLAVVYSELGRSEEARAEWAEAQRLNPGMSMETVRRMGFFKDPAVTERYITALREIVSK
jgi:tetratricopeptide (TPR) repeat protein